MKTIYSLPDVHVRTLQFVPGLNGGVATSTTMANSTSGDSPLKADMVWVGTDTQK